MLRDNSNWIFYHQLTFNLSKANASSVLNVPFFYSILKFYPLGYNSCLWSLYTSVQQTFLRIRTFFFSHRFPWDDWKRAANLTDTSSTWFPLTLLPTITYCTCFLLGLHATFIKIYYQGKAGSNLRNFWPHLSYSEDGEMVPREVKLLIFTQLLKQDKSSDD